MTEAERIIKIILPDLLRYIKKQESGEIFQKRLDKKLFPSIHCEDQQELDDNGGIKCNQ